MAYIEGPFPFRGEVIWLTPDQAGRRSGIPPAVPGVSYAQVAHVPPHTVHSGSASFVLRGWDPEHWRSPAEGRWLFAENEGDYLVDPGDVVVVTEGTRAVALFLVESVDSPPGRTARSSIVDCEALGPVQRAFAPVIGLRSWLVRRGYGTFITLEFGDPHVGVRHARKTTFAGRRVRSRLSAVHGEWHLWIYGSSWKLDLEGELAAHSEADGVDIERALAILDGQSIQRVDVETRTGSTVFQFDLGATLRVESIGPDESGDPEDLWLLYQPTGQVLTVRSDGSYGAQDDLRGDPDVWNPLPQ